MPAPVNGNVVLNLHTAADFDGYSTAFERPMSHPMASPTALLESDARQPASTDSGAPAADRADGARPGQGRLVLFAAVTTTVALLFRYGYSFGLFDQTVYSLRGIALADPSAFRSDWFARTVPQPHWLFDVVTYLGTRLGMLPAVYLAYWLAGILAFAVGSVWLTRRFLPDRPALAAALGPIVVLGPANLLGSTTPLVWFADPHMLGGCLAFLALCGLLTDRWRAASLAALAAGLFHIQHGANLAPVLILTAILATHATARRRLLLVATALALVAGAAGVAQWRGLQTTGDQWLVTCKRLIPFHCFAPSWGPGYLAAGGVVFAAAAGFAWSARRQWRSVVPAVALPAAGLLLGVLAERFELGALGRLAAQFNVHRLATLVEPFAAFGLLCLMAGAALGRRHVRIRRAGVAVVALVVWSTMSESAVRGPRAVAALVVVALTAGLLAWFAPRHAARSRPRAVAALAGLAIVTIAAGAQGYLGHVGYDRSLPTVRAALAIKATVPATAIIAAPPDMYWLRSISERSVVADCKAVPYGGPLWDEYMVRMRDLGGNCEGRANGWRALSPEAVESLRSRYGVTHALLQDDDPKVAYARAHWRQVFQAPAEDFEFFEHGLLLFDTTAGPS
jgi:hypothetical protein